MHIVVNQSKVLYTPSTHSKLPHLSRFYYVTYIVEDARYATINKHLSQTLVVDNVVKSSKFCYG